MQVEIREHHGAATIRGGMNVAAWQQFINHLRDHCAAVIANRNAAFAVEGSCSI